MEALNLCSLYALHATTTKVNGGGGSSRVRRRET
jgi:hypothetical protein